MVFLHVGWILFSLVLGQRTYQNPVQRSNCADPAVTRGLDGYYYLYVTSTQLQDDATIHFLPIYRSVDLVNWSYIGDALPERPEWEYPGASGPWAPSMHYIKGKYYLYYTVNAAKELPAYGTPSSTNESSVAAIGLAVGETPQGPFINTGPPGGGSLTYGPVVPPRRADLCTNGGDPSCYTWLFDPFVYQEQSGQRIIYDGSFYGGDFLDLLEAGASSIIPNSTVKFGHDWRYEASFLLYHIDASNTTYYYMFNSQSDCCSGAESPYSVVVSRSVSPTGPFVDKHGLSMDLYHGSPQNSSDANLGGEGGGYAVIKQDGHAFVGLGGQASIRDLAGQNWLTYHGVVQANPVFPFGILRQFFIDPLFWTEDGWPFANNNSDPSKMNRVPVTIPLLGDNFNAKTTGAPPWPDAVTCSWHYNLGQWVMANSSVNGGFLQQMETCPFAIVRSSNQVRTSAHGFHFEVDAKGNGSGSFGGGVHTYNQSIQFWVDASQQVWLGVYDADQKPMGSLSRGTLGPGVDLLEWHRLVIEYNGVSVVTAMVENEDQQLLARLTSRVEGWAGELLGVALMTANGTASFDNVALASRALTNAKPAGPPAYTTKVNSASDDFGYRLGSQWHWLRENSSLHGFAPGGALRLTSNGCLDEFQRISINATNPPDLPITQNVLLQPAPRGSFMVQTRLHFNPQTANLVAGLMIYSDDDTNVWVGICWNGGLTMVETLRNQLTGVIPPATTCPLEGPMSGAYVAIGQYTPTQCPAQSDHSSQEYPVNFDAFVPNGQTGGNINPGNVSAYLRIYREGNILSPWYSHDNRSWSRANAWSLETYNDRFPFQIGLFAQNNQQTDVQGADAWFDYVYVYE